MDVKQIVDSFINDVRERLNLFPSNVIGLDIGTSAIKLAEFSHLNDGTLKLMKFSLVPLPEGSFLEDEISKPDVVSAAIKKALKESKVSECSFCIGLAGPNTLARKLQLAGGDAEEIEDQVLWEVEQYVPFGFDESTTSFDELGENAGGGVDIFVSVVRNNVVEAYKNLVEQTKLKVRVIDMSVIAAANIFEHTMGEKLKASQASWILIDFGAQRTQFIIYKGNSIAFCKEMAIGGLVITEEIQRQMGVNFEDAEDLKIFGDENGNLPEEILDILDDVIEGFLVDIKKTLDFYITATSDESFSGGYVTGGTSLIPGLLEGLEDTLDVKFSILNPFEKIKFDKKKFKEQELEAIISRGAVALGLAMRVIK